MKKDKIKELDLTDFDKKVPESLALKDNQQVLIEQTMASPPKKVELIVQPSEEEDLIDGVKLEFVDKV